MDKPQIQTLGELKKSDYVSRSVRDEVRENMIAALKQDQDLFPGIIGYEQTVVPQLVNAILSRHDILLLGLRGQAKTKLLRCLSDFLDEWMPAIAGTTLREDPYHPILPHTVEMVETMGDDLPIDWVHRSDRFYEKLATPDANMADMIGDIDPIRASREKLDLSDERVIHFGIVPRSHRSLFCINEVPDLQPRIQVGLLNLLEEKDIQIRGFPLRLEVDVMMLFTANPEDYTNRGRIITPLKDRIASQILTHYPKNLEESISIFVDESDKQRSFKIELPPLVEEIIAEIAVQGRKSEHVDQSSGVSARLTIAAYEILLSNLERRSLIYQQQDISTRLCDLYALVPSISGKLELVYEGQEAGADVIAGRLISLAIKAVFTRYFPKANDESDQWKAVTDWFNSGHQLELFEADSESQRQHKLKMVTGLKDMIDMELPDLIESEKWLAMEIALEGLHQYSLLSKEGLGASIVYGDMFSNMMDSEGL
jgi:magnesium chelatase subunit I